jgi:hypothetical protein
MAYMPNPFNIAVQHPQRDVLPRLFLTAHTVTNEAHEARIIQQRQHRRRIAIRVRSHAGAGVHFRSDARADLQPKPRFCLSPRLLL